MTSYANLADLVDLRDTLAELMGQVGSTQAEQILKENPIVSLLLLGPKFFYRGTRKQVLVSFANFITEPGSVTFYTVTSNKTFYLKSLTITADGVTQCVIRDGTADGATIKLRAQMGTSSPVSITFDPPLTFTSGVRIDTGDMSALRTIRMTGTGWEDPTG